MPKLLEGKIGLITGANRGIGKAIAEEFLEEGAQVYAVTREEGSLDAWKIQQEKKSHIVHIISCDLTHAGASKLVIQKIQKECGRLDVLVNNAGVSSQERIGMISRKQMEAVFEVNVFAVIELLQYAARLMKRQKQGVILNLASIVGVYGDPGQAVYAASKGAVIALTKSAAKELAEDQIRVNAIAPGMVDTQMFQQSVGNHLEERLGQIALGRLAQPEEIAGICAFLASDKAAYITGEVFGVNGGSTL